MAVRYPTLGGIILTGGRSRRMGTDKYLLPLSGTTLVGHLISQLNKSAAEVILVTPEPEKLDFLPEKKFHDIFSVPCALSGLHAGLVHSSYEINFVLACNLPLFDPRMVEGMMEFWDEGTLSVVPETGQGVESLCGIYSKRCIPAIETMFDEDLYAVNELVRRLPAKVVPAGIIESRTHPDVFFNMNTPEDYRAALRFFAVGSGGKK